MHNFLLRPGGSGQKRNIGRDKSREVVLETACETRDLDGAIKAAKTDLLKRRQLVQALFYFATKERAFSDEATKRSAALENPISEISWFLSCGEVDTSKRINE